MALFNDNTEYKNDNIFSLTTDVYHDLLESYDYNLDITKAIHKHDINDITLTESYNKTEILREGIGDIFRTIKDKIIHLWNIVKNFFKRIFGINKDISKTNKEIAKKTEEAIKDFPDNMEDIQNNSNDESEEVDKRTEKTIKDFPDNMEDIQNNSNDESDDDSIDNADQTNISDNLEEIDDLDKDLNDYAAHINFKERTYYYRNFLVFSTDAIKKIFNIRTPIDGLDDCTIEGITSLGKLENIDNEMLLGYARASIIDPSNKVSIDDKPLSNDKFKKRLSFKLVGFKGREYSFTDRNNIGIIIDRLKHSDELLKLVKKLESDTNERFKKFLGIVDKIKNDHNNNNNKSSYIKGEKDYLIMGCNKYTIFLQSMCNLITTIVNIYIKVFNAASKNYRKLCSIYTQPWWKNHI